MRSRYLPALDALPCIVCKGPQDGIASWPDLGIKTEIPICYQCRDNGALANWLAETIFDAPDTQQNNQALPPPTDFAA